ncbi:MAG: hypothetical protein MH204_11790 [Fimbriimonadaceae bacterium]|nr:hypothetical protein [Fimbriimonadaceae bacterium]
MAAKLIAACAVVGLGLIAAGCGTDQGPNDPVVSGESINEDRMNRLPEEERRRMAESQAAGAIPGAAPEGTR